MSHPISHPTEKRILTQVLAYVSLRRIQLSDHCRATSQPRSPSIHLVTTPSKPAIHRLPPAASPDIQRPMPSSFTTRHLTHLRECTALLCHR